MKQLNKEVRKIIAEKIIDLVNLIFIGLVIGQFIPETKIKIPELIFGILSLIFGYAGSIIIIKGGVKK